jgi:hypothetical protein
MCGVGRLCAPVVAGICGCGRVFPGSLVRDQRGMSCCPCRKQSGDMCGIMWVVRAKASVSPSLRCRRRSCIRRRTLSSAEIGSEDSSANSDSTGDRLRVPTGPFVVGVLAARPAALSRSPLELVRRHTYAPFVRYRLIAAHSCGS